MKSVSGRFRPWTLLLAAAAAALLFLASGEIALRTLRLAGFYPVELYGTGNNYLEQRLHQLDVFYHRNGPPDYLFIGNSKVGQGVDPETVSRAFEDASGRKVNCFNFGFGGNTSEFLPVICRILEEDYPPGKYVLDVLGPYQMDNESQKESKWLRYRSGDFSCGGWIIEHSHLMRMFLRMRHWMEHPHQVRMLVTVVRDQGKLRDQEIPAEKRRELLEKELAARAEGHFLPDDLGPQTDSSRREEACFPEVFDLIGPERMALFECPVSCRIARGIEDLGYLVRRSGEYSRRYGIPLVRMPDPGTLPPDGWMKDGVHMERPAVEAFSTWLGRALAEAEGLAQKEARVETEVTK